MNYRRWLAVAGLGLISLAVVGCDSTTSDEVAIKVDPPTATIDQSNGSQTFTAKAVNTNLFLMLPLEWSVSNPSLGSIISSGGASAVYKRAGGAKGANSVIVRDQIGAEGVASVNQP